MERDNFQVAGQAVLGRLNALRVGDGMTYDRMVVFPVFPATLSKADDPGAADEVNSNHGTKLNYCTLEEAIAEGWCS